MFSKMHARSQKGFTLVELLVVIGIIGILAMLLLPQFRGMRDRARVASCQSNLKNISTQLESEYADRDRYPTSTDWSALTSGGRSLDRLAHCPANTTGNYAYTVDPTNLPSATGDTEVYDPGDTAEPSTGNNYAVLCDYHTGEGTDFPTNTQLFVTPDGVRSRTISGGTGS